MIGGVWARPTPCMGEPDGQHKIEPGAKTRVSGCLCCLFRLSPALLSQGSLVSQSLETCRSELVTWLGVREWRSHWVW